jgi:hypothetical protein
MDLITSIVSAIGSVVKAIYAALDYHRKGAMESSGSSNPKRHYITLALLALIAWGAVGFGYYDRYYSSRDAMSALFSLPGYDRLIQARSSREGAEEGYEKATHIWAASITGHYFALLPHESRKKIDRAIFVDPSSESMKILANIQEPRGDRFSEDVEDAVALCKSEKIDVRLSSHPVLNVVLFDPETDHAWARVQEFIPYHLGEESVVYAIRKEEWKDLYKTIEDSFEQTWENGKDPNK